MESGSSNGGGDGMNVLWSLGGLSHLQTQTNLGAGSDWLGAGGILDVCIVIVIIIIIMSVEIVWDGG